MALIIVANRLPLRPVQEKGKPAFQRSTGGLVSALLPLAEAERATWVGWDGGETASWSQILRKRSRQALPFRVAPVALPEGSRGPYYDGFCNATLWPLFHGFLGRTEFSETWWSAYRESSRAFADRIAGLARSGDMVWIHDYHLMLLPSLLRAAGLRSRIVFFLHIPFPADDSFRHLPWRAELLAGLRGANVIGTQTPEDARHLRQCLALFGPPGLRRPSRTRRGRGTVLRANPISIDTRRLAREARAPAVCRRVEAMREAFHGRRVILSVERLDYAKGILERLRAVEHLFEARRDLRGRVSFLQLSVPTREGVRAYEGYRRQVDEMVGRINGRFSQPEWVPIRYLFRSLPEGELLAYYRVADVLFVTSLKDGMNLVAKEYVAARGGEDGVLVLSEFTGAAHELRGALPVNPHHTTETAAMLARALEMPPMRRRTRMKDMFRHLLRHTVHDWIRECLE
jgi:trehalose 6-phosphate synthase/phosphatase